MQMPSWRHSWAPSPHDFRLFKQQCPACTQTTRKRCGANATRPCAESATAATGKGVGRRPRGPYLLWDSRREDAGAALGKDIAKFLALVDKASAKGIDLIEDICHIEIVSSDAGFGFL